jgi:hypothetical protein
MSTASQFVVPDEIELLEFFGGDAVEGSPKDGYWCYEMRDRRGISLRLSFSLYERSVQTMLLVGGGAAMTVSHEGADQMSVRFGKLVCEFSGADSKTSLTIDRSPELAVTWSTIRTG